MSEDKREDLLYLRTGYIDLERPSDELVTYADRLMPGTGTLPKRWSYESHEKFLEDHGDLGSLVWARTASYHMLLVKGVHAFRIWTDAKTSCLVDLDDKLAASLQDTFEIEDSPESTWKKTKPFTKRTRITTMREVEILLLQTLVTFGAA